MTNPTKDSLDHMIQRFLMWKLPEPWRPDAGISFKPSYDEEPMRSRHWPTGTNLFDYTQAKAMVLHMFEGLPEAERQPVNWQDNMDFEPSAEAYVKVKHLHDSYFTIALRLIDHLEGRAPVKVDRDERALIDILRELGSTPDDYTTSQFDAALAKFKEMTNG